eukprot:scaffold16230_cov63-Phaeocystis_antarctica.AAC.1
MRRCLLCDEPAGAGPLPAPPAPAAAQRGARPAALGPAALHAGAARRHSRWSGAAGPRAVSRGRHRLGLLHTRLPERGGGAGGGRTARRLARAHVAADARQACAGVWQLHG